MISLSKKSYLIGIVIIPGLAFAIVGLMLGPEFFKSEYEEYGEVFIWQCLACIPAFVFAVFGLCMALRSKS